MKIRRVQVENLRAIRGMVELDGLASFEVIHGDNNSGKSSLMLGIAVGLHLMGREQVWQGPEAGTPMVGLASDDEAPPGILVKLPPRFDKLARHHSKKAQPIRVRLDFEDLVGLAAVELELRKTNVASWHVQGRWWAPGEADQEGRMEPLPPIAPPPRFTFVDAERRGPWADVWEGSPKKRSTWDMEVIQAARVPEDVDARKRLKAIERALALFAPELGGAGELQEVTSREGDLELAWISSEDSPADRFSDQGSGVRSVKDILIAAAGGLVDVVLIEEPEIHLSASALDRLRNVLVGLSYQGRQVILSSHVYGLDGPHVWRLSRAEGEVTARRSDPSVHRPPLEVAFTEAHERALRRLYVQAGQPHPGFISRDGITQVPQDMLNELHAPTNVAWARVREGVYGMVTLEALDRQGGPASEPEAP